MAFTWEPPPASNEQTQKWRAWIETIKRDVWNTYYHRDLFLRTLQLVESNPAIETRTFWFAFFENIYVDSVAMAVRRQLKERDSISMGRLLRQIAAEPHLVTRSDFAALYRENFEFNGILQSDRDFEKFAAPGAPSIDGSLVQADLDSLRNLAAEVEEYADRRIAHWDPRSPSKPLTRGLIFDAVDELGRLVQRYSLLLTATSVELHPVPQGPVWHIFETPWLPPDWRNLPKPPWQG